MQQPEILHKRNVFVFYTMSISLSIYIAAMIIGVFEYRHQYVVPAIISIVLLGIFFYLKTPPNIMRIILMIIWNITILFYICYIQHIATFFWLIFSILMFSIYQSIIVNITVVLIGCLQIAIIYFFIFDITQSLQYVTQVPLFFLLLFCTISIMQTIFVLQTWGKYEYKNLKKEWELTSTEAYLRLFFEHADDAMAVFDLNNKIINVNPAFEKLYGWTREECIGNSLQLVPIQNVKVAKDRFDRLLRGERFPLLETQDMKKDGTVFDAQISLSPILNHHDEMIAVSVISRDISYIKENERLIVQSEKLKLAGEIAAGVAHEIRNPMTVISGFVQMMNADEQSPYKRYTELIQSEIERIDLIISEFLVLSRPQAEMFKPINMEKIVKDIADFFTIELQNRHIDFSLQLNHHYTMINGNENQIKQVFINLIKNAIEAIDRDGKIHLELNHHNDRLFISIKDTGIGIPPHVLDKIFEPFYTTKSKGTGLGMMITNKIIQEHKGTINVRSEENVGTEVLISFPTI